MIGANELTGDAGLEKAGQWKAWFRYTSLEGPCWAEAPCIPVGICFVYECVCLDGSTGPGGHYTLILLSWLLSGSTDRSS